MSDYEDVADSEPPTIDPYDVLDLEKTATADQIKSAYRKAALKHHPGPLIPIICGALLRNTDIYLADKVRENEKKRAHETFQSIAFAYAILSDPARRERYDTTGSTTDSIVDSEGFNWSDYYREQFKDSISADAIRKFAEKYKGSDEEKEDILIAFELCEGDMDQVYENVMLSNVLEDDERFRKIIYAAIEAREVPNFQAYTRESATRRNARVKKARAEAAEAVEYAKELGVHDKLFEDEKKTKKGKGSSEDGLAALIRKRQQDMQSIPDMIAEKYGAKEKKTKKGKKRVAEEEPSEEEFQAAAARLANAKKSKR
ncbi:hypothetical protein G7046_g7291 [Stylonectria norvegica]|nr:hypothetical protein G7046_g7291 [Stylonectria norvegica]